MTQSNDPLENLRQNFEKTFNEHGYGFHHSVIKRAVELRKQGKSHWDFEVAEFPVEVRGKDTRIDFIMSLNIANHLLPRIYLIAECKRVNPAFGTWCFGRSSFFNRSRSSENYVVEHIKRNDALYFLNKAELFNSFVTQNPYENNIYNLALEIKTNNPGNSSNQGRPGQAIEDASGQVLRGMNGFIDYLSRNPNLLTKVGSAIVLPVIFTTGDIWTTDVDISGANIEDGNINISIESLNKRSWIGYQYHQSPGLIHSLNSAAKESSLGELMDGDFVRTIPIVTPAGLEDFLSWSSTISLWSR